MKVLFLDIDGILTHPKCIADVDIKEEFTKLFDDLPMTHTRYNTVLTMFFDTNAMTNLNMFLELYPEVQLVLSSIWQLKHWTQHELHDIFHKHHMLAKRLIECISEIDKHVGIAQWLQNHPECTHYAILDNTIIHENVVKVNSSTLLTQENLMETIEFLDIEYIIFNSLSFALFYQQLNTFAIQIYEESDLEKTLNINMNASIEDVAKCCFELYTAYKKDNMQSGHLLLWIIKKYTGCNYTLPSLLNFDTTTVYSTLSFVFMVGGKLTNLKNFIAIFVYRYSRCDKFLFQLLLNSEVLDLWFDLLIHSFQTTSSLYWPSKFEYIANILETVDESSKEKIAYVLKESQDDDTSNVGKYIINIFKTKCFNDAIPYLYGLHNISLAVKQAFDSSWLNIMFRYPFVSLFNDNHQYNNELIIPNTRCLMFTNENVLVFQDVMIGLYKSPFGWGSNPPVFYLLAYNLQTEQVLWGLPFDKQQESANVTQDFIFGMPSSVANMIVLRKHNNMLIITHKKQKEIFFIEPHTGHITNKIICDRIADDMHVSTCETFIFQLINKGYMNRLIIGSDIDKSGLKLKFEKQTSIGQFVPLSYHCGIFNSFAKTITIYNRIGHIVLLNCISVKAYQNHLFSLEQKYDKKPFILNIRLLLESELIVSDILHSLNSNFDCAKIERIFSSECVILVDEHHVFYANFLTSTVVSYTNIRHCSEHLVDDNGNVWSKSYNHNTVQKLTPEGKCQSIGKVRGDLICVVESCLYYCK